MSQYVMTFKIVSVFNVYIQTKIYNALFSFTTYFLCKDLKLLHVGIVNLFLRFSFT